MEALDLNLVAALDALLAENSVTTAAAVLHTSAPAMSRTLARLRRVLDDPILVRAGRGLVPTPRALELRAEAHEVVTRARRLFVPAQDLDPAKVTRVFSLQMSDLFLATVGAGLIADVRKAAPGISLRFVPDSLEDTPALREGRVDLEIGVLGDGDPETRAETLATDRMIGVVRATHPLTRGRVTPRRFAAADHLVVSRRGRARGPIDDRLAELDLVRRVAAVVPTYAASLLMARDSDVVCLAAADTGREALDAFGLRTFEIPLDLPPFELGMAWHPRNDADRTHRWLRDRVRQVFTAAP
ncbi:LysR family transcriptional regulator [Amycolatopsis sp. H20-H5]|uniref:LysR family transcriptional regulator n=1 Tax=Amycolatopsis sp. H20-H5 TaxID=3046309 RepID=UPI002DBEAB9E|nr:LysR family transcriptional regulator [Amycolatopsis sp. H20-H5]MEC3977144.1 LysR family transcriptional regulator [Amycolatopsis sp. H20-H5]